MRERIVFAYAGGVEASSAIQRLVETCEAEVVTLTLDLGQGQDLEEVRDGALASGAVRAHVFDVREAFARDFVLPALQAGALHEGRDPMAAALGRSLIAKTLVETAAIEQATAVAHGCTGTDRERMDASVRALNRDIRVIAAVRAGGPRPRVYANLWGRAYMAANAQIPNRKSQIPSPRPESRVPSHESHLRAETPNTPACVEIAFERGVPAAINGVPMALTELVESLSVIAGQHGVGRIAVEERVEEIPEEGDVRGVWLHRVSEAPAAVVLHAAHAALEASVLAPDLARLKRDRAAEYARLVGDGLWFSPAREAIDAFNAVAQERVTGSVLIRLFEGELLSCEAGDLAAAVVPRT